MPLDRVEHDPGVRAGNLNRLELTAIDESLYVRGLRPSNLPAVGTLTNLLGIVVPSYPRGYGTFASSCVKANGSGQI